MASRGYEYKHMECPQITELVNHVTNDYAKFFWELTNTQTVVSKESHLESGDFNPDNLYSVTTTERFVALDFRRATDIQNLQKIKAVEREYFEICASMRNLGASPIDNWFPPQPASFGIMDVLFISSIGAMLQPRFWVWVLTLGPYRNFFKIGGILGFIFIGYGYIRAMGASKQDQEQCKVLKAKLDNLIDTNKTILNVT